jgi:hypothetical protein
MADARPDVVTLTGVRLSFPKVWKAEQSTPDSKPKFGASFIIDPDSDNGKAVIKKIEAAIKKIKTDTWKEKAQKIYDNIEVKRKAFVSGDDMTNGEGDVYAGYEDMMIVKASNVRRPQVLNRDKSALTEEDNVIYGGCYVDAVVSFYAVTKKEQGGNGLFATLEVVRYRKEGEAFGAAPVDADDYLDDLDDDEDSDDLI